MDVNNIKYRGEQQYEKKMDVTYFDAYGGLG